MDQQALAKRITQDWITLREQLGELNSLKSALHMEPSLLNRLDEGLSNFPNITEFLTNTINFISQSIARAARSVPSLLELSNIDSVIRILIFCVGAQHGLAQGTVKIKLNYPLDTRTTYTVQEIVNHLKKLQANFPELSKNQFLISILNLYQNYLATKESFRQQSPLVSDDEAPAFYTNFKLKVDSLTQEMQHIYQDLLKQLTPNQTSDLDTNPFLNDALARVLSSLAQELCRLHSTVNLAIEEGHGFREEFIRLSDKKDLILALVKEETSILKRLGNQTDSLAVLLGRQVQLVIRD